MMHPFFKGDKSGAGKAAAGSNQKLSKDKKQREKPVPWVEKVRKIYFACLLNRI